jgi:glyceraldehyde 3-phosphate dehydrogenase
VTRSVRVGINGFGRIGRLSLRAAFDWPELEFVHINEANGDASVSAHLLEFDSVHGRWHRDIRADDDHVIIDGRVLTHSSHADPADIPWSEHGVEIVLEASGKFRTMANLQPHFDRGILHDQLPRPSGQGDSRGHWNQTWRHHHAA